MWNTFFTMNFSVNQQTFTAARCPVANCLITEDESLYNRSDVVVFAAQTMSDIPLYRFHRQRFVFYETESPANAMLLPFMIEHVRFDYFNWTMTYRSDSDIVHRYGTINQLKMTKGKFADRNAAEWRGGKKTKLVAWFVSHCSTGIRREEYVRQLSKFIPVDIYGSCGNLTCGCDNKSLCLEMLRSDYKFYLAFENSLCPDYVTEKLFQTLMYDTVPVVLGGVDYDRFAPPHSFIDVRQFESAKQLADYLLLLDLSDHLYARYFDWKRHYEIQFPYMNGWCDLCRMAHQSSVLPRKSYPDIKTWWLEKNKCFSFLN